MFQSQLWKIFTVIAILLSFTADILGWIGYGVPDWHAFQRYNGSPTEYYGLWAYCQEQPPTYTTVCKRWSTADDQLYNGTRPNFIKTSEGLITTGMIFLSLGLALTLLALVIPVLTYLGALFAFLSFLFLVIGLPIFGRQSNSMSMARGDYRYYKRYGFWLFVPTIVLEFLSLLFRIASGILRRQFASKKSPYGSSANAKVYGGQRALGVPHMLNTYGMMTLPTGITPSLLSEYAAAHRSASYSPLMPQSRGDSVLPQPTVYQALLCRPASTVTPAYTRSEQPYQPLFDPLINFSDQIVTGPLERIS